jgi:hypothetical protein
MPLLIARRMCDAKGAIFCIPHQKKIKIKL